MSTKVRKRSQFGGILHNSMSTWSPFPVLRVAVSAYKMQRVLLLHGEAAPTGHPSREVVAGCAIAIYLVKLYCLRVLDNVVRLHPRATLDVFIDDSHQSGQGTPREARKLIVAAGRTFTKGVQKHLRVQVADKKTGHVPGRQTVPRTELHEKSNIQIPIDAKHVTRHHAHRGDLEQGPNSFSS